MIGDDGIRSRLTDVASAHHGSVTGEQRRVELYDVLSRIEASDCGRTDGTRCRLFEDKAIVTGTDRHRGILSSVNRVVAVACGNMIEGAALSIHRITGAVAECDRVGAANVGHRVIGAVAEGNSVQAATAVEHHVAGAVAECDRGEVTIVAYRVNGAVAKGNLVHGASGAHTIAGAVA